MQSAGPGRAAILLRLGAVHENLRNDLPRAAEVYELAVAEDPDDADCLRALGRVREARARSPFTRTHFWPIKRLACVRERAS